MSRLTIIGTGRWPDHLARLLTDHGSLDVEAIDIRDRGWALSLLRSSGPVLRVGLRPGASNRNGRLFDAIWRAAVTLRRRDAVYYWIGSDVWDSVNGGDLVPRWALDRPHWVGAPWFAAELAPLGVEAKNMWFPTERPLLDRTSSMMPSGPFTVSAYVPGFNAELYGWPFIQHVAGALPAIRFEIFGAGSEALHATDNVSLLGEVADGAAVIAAGHVHLRPTRHDAFAGTVREALALSRYVGFSQPFEGVFTVDLAQPEATIEWLEELSAIHDHGGLAPNHLGRDALDALFADDRAITSFVEHCSELVR